MSRHSVQHDLAARIPSIYETSMLALEMSVITATRITGAYYSGSPQSIENYIQGSHSTLNPAASS